jgi:hypothetical protein
MKTMVRRVILLKRVILTALISGCLAVLIMGAAAAAGTGEKGPSAGGALTKENWQQDARIKTIEAIVQGVNAGITGGSIKTAKRVFEYCQPYGIVERVIAKDASGRCGCMKSGVAPTIPIGGYSVTTLRQGICGSSL